MWRGNNSLCLFFSHGNLRSGETTPTGFRLWHGLRFPFCFLWGRRHRCPNPPLTHHRCPNPQHRLQIHHSPNTGFQIHSTDVHIHSTGVQIHHSLLATGILWCCGLWANICWTTEHSCAYGEPSEDPKPQWKQREWLPDVPLVVKQVFHGHCLVTPCRDRELSLGKAPCGTLASDSSAITALSQEDLVASKNHFQTCPSCKNQRIELPIIPTVRHDNSTCVPTKGKGKAWSIDYSSHALQ